MQSENVSCLFFVTAGVLQRSAGHALVPRTLPPDADHPLIGMDQDLPADEDAAANPQSDFHSIWWEHRKKSFAMGPRNAVRPGWTAFRASCSSMASSASDRQWRLMGTAELKQLAEAGMTIGAHSLSHAVLSLCSDEEARCEIQDSKIQLETALGRPVWAFAYPFGYGFTVGERELRMAQESGYSCASERGHWDTSATSPCSEPTVTSDMTLPEFRSSPKRSPQAPPTSRSRLNRTTTSPEQS